MPVVIVGEVVAGRYELEELVGTGGMSSVYRARDRVLDRHVAIKILHERFTRDEDYLERFRREARAAAQLSHPNIVTVIDRGDEEGRPFIVFEFVDGETLKRLVEREAPLPVGEALELSLQVAEALAFAHGRGVIHRDVKPQNVLLAEDGRAKVTDFGIARSVDIDVAVTQTGTVLGTGDYMAPEQALGEQTSERSDVYSLGAVLYELLSGDVVFSGDSFVAVAMQHASAPPPSLLQRRPDCPVRLAAAVDRCLAKEPEERFASMQELVRELEACLSELDARGDEDATLIVPPRKTRREPRARRRRRRVIPWIVLLAGVAALSGITVFVILDRSRIGDTLPFVGPKTIKLKAAATYDPEGDNGVENPQLKGRATDGNSDTYWQTEYYNSWPAAGYKEGVGLVLDAGKAERLSEVSVVTDTPGFSAQITAGPTPTGPFEPVSKRKRLTSKTTYDLDLGRGSYRYYVVWLRLPSNGSMNVAKINEVTAKA
jgi:eukaryotic-like serine/threonine-protein kinase